MVCYLAGCQPRETPTVKTAPASEQAVALPERETPAPENKAPLPVNEALPSLKKQDHLVSVSSSPRHTWVILQNLFSLPDTETTTVLNLKRNLEAKEKFILHNSINNELQARRFDPRLPQALQVYFRNASLDEKRALLLNLLELCPLERTHLGLRPYKAQDWLREQKFTQAEELLLIDFMLLPRVSIKESVLAWAQDRFGKNLGYNHSQYRYLLLSSTKASPSATKTKPTSKSVKP